jgi:hypothetical protein
MVSFSVVVSNSSNNPVNVILEPWADEHSLPANGELLVHVEGPVEDPRTDRLQIDYKEGQIVIYGWEHSSVRIVNEAAG